MQFVSVYTNTYVHLYLKEISSCIDSFYTKNSSLWITKSNVLQDGCNEPAAPLLLLHLLSHHICSEIKGAWLKMSPRVRQKSSLKITKWKGTFLNNMNEVCTLATKTLAFVNVTIMSRIHPLTVPKGATKAFL